MSTWRARAEYDPYRAGVKIVVGRPIGEQRSEVIVWPQSITVRQTAPPTSAAEDEYLRIDEDAARAMYEALADYFGGAGNDTRALRKDYDAERKRVDAFISHLTAARP